MKKLYATIIAIVICGCSSTTPTAVKTHDLGPEWSPIRQIRVRGISSGPTGAVLGLAIASDSTVTTIAPYVYVKDVATFLRRNPPGSPQFRALLSHEREHAKRQLARGLYSWLWNYLYDKEFALDEEKHGWYHELMFYRKAGLPIARDVVAATLANYVNLTGRITTFDDARRWVDDVLAGKWTPNE